MHETPQHTYEIKRQVWILRDGEAAPGDTPPAPTPDPPKTPEPTPDPPKAPSPAEIDRMVEQRVQAARDQIRQSVQGEMERKYGARIDELTELETLRQEKEERVRKEAEAKGEYRRAMDSMKESQERQQNKWNQEKEQLVAELRRTRVDGELRAASSGAVKPEQIARLLADRVKLDEDNFEVKVLDEGGEPMMREGRGMTVAELVESYLQDNPHLAKSTQAIDRSAGAAGSAGSAGASEKTHPEIAKLEEQWRKADEKATKSQQPSDIATAYSLKRRLDAKRKEVAEGIK